MSIRTPRAFVRAQSAFVILMLSWLPIAARVGAAKTHPPELSAAALSEVPPEGYKLEKTMACDLAPGLEHEYLVALSDADNSEDGIPEKPVMLLLVAADEKIVVEDRVVLHDANFFSGISKETVGGRDLFLVTSVGAWGGSGSNHYFDFFRPEKKKLRLVKGFAHGRMQVPYFALYKNAIYDAELVCTRGEKRGKAYVYTCYLAVTKYGYDGDEIRPVASERLREQRGNRYLADKYWFVSVRKALQASKIFAQEDGRRVDEPRPQIRSVRPNK